MDANRNPATGRIQTRALVLAWVLMLLTGCFEPKAMRAREMEGVNYVDGTWIGLADLGVAHPPDDWNGVSWPIVVLREQSGPTIVHILPPDIAAPATRPAYPPPPLVDHNDRIIEVAGIRPGTKVAVSGRLYSRRLPLAPDKTRVTSMKPGWVWGQPVIRVDEVEEILPDTRRRELDWGMADRRVRIP